MATSTAARTGKSSVKASPAKAPAKDKSSKDKAPAKAKTLKTVEQFYSRHNVDTKGTFRFVAVEPKTGAVLPNDDKAAHATQLYVRRGSSALSADPKFLRVTIEELSALPKGATVTEEEDD